MIPEADEFTEGLLEELARLRSEVRELRAARPEARLQRKSDRIGRVMKLILIMLHDEGGGATVKQMNEWLYGSAADEVSARRVAAALNRLCGLTVATRSRAAIEGRWMGPGAGSQPFVYRIVVNGTCRKILHRIRSGSEATKAA